MEVLVLWIVHMIHLLFEVSKLRSQLKMINPIKRPLYRTGLEIGECPKKCSFYETGRELFMGAVVTCKALITMI